MVSSLESLEVNCLFEYKQLIKQTKEWLYGPLFYSSNNDLAWRLQIDRSHPTNLGIYLTLISGAPCTIRSYTLSIATHVKPSLILFNNRCTQRRVFPSNDFSWGFANFCTRGEVKDERKLIRNPNTKLVILRCIMNIEVLPQASMHDDHRLATDLFHTRSLEQWIVYLKGKDDLPELTNRVNEEIEARL